MGNNQKKDYLLQLQKLEVKIELIKQMATVSGFIELYFKELKTAKTQAEAFNNLNNKYYEFTGEYKYSSFDSFRKARNYYLKRPIK